MKKLNILGALVGLTFLGNGITGCTEAPTQTVEELKVELTANQALLEQVSAIRMQSMGQDPRMQSFIDCHDGIDKTIKDNGLIRNKTGLNQPEPDRRVCGDDPTTTIFEDRKNAQEEAQKKVDETEINFKEAEKRNSSKS